MENKEKVVKNNRVVYENCYESFLEIVENNLRKLEKIDSIPCLLFFDNKNTSFIEKLGNDMIHEYESVAFAKTFFETSLLIELMKANESSLSKKNKSLDDLEAFANILQKEDKSLIIQNLEKAGTLEEILYEFKKGNKRKFVVIFLRNVKNKAMQKRINNYIKARISSTPYEMQVLSNDNFCTYETTLGEKISPQNDYIKKEPMSEDKISEYIRLKEISKTNGRKM